MWADCDVTKPWYKSLGTYVKSRFHYINIIYNKFCRIILRGESHTTYYGKGGWNRSILFVSRWNFFLSLHRAVLFFFPITIQRQLNFQKFSSLNSVGDNWSLPRFPISFPLKSSAAPPPPKQAINMTGPLPKWYSSLRIIWANQGKPESLL